MPRWKCVKLFVTSMDVPYAKKIIIITLLILTIMLIEYWALSSSFLRVYEHAWTKSNSCIYGCLNTCKKST